MAVRFIVVGNPENRRVGLFQAALAAQRQPAAEVVSWLDVMQRFERLEALSPEPAVVRLDSAGEDFEVEREFLKAGYQGALAAGATTLAPEAVDALQYERGLILCPRQQHLGFLAALQRLDDLFQRRLAWRVLNPVRDVATLFDKRETSRLYQSLGVPVPPRLEPVTSRRELRERMDEAGCRSAFIKMSASSSASCLAIYHRRQQGDCVFTTIEPTRSGWYNSLKVRRLENPRLLDEVVGFLLREGSQVEQEVPKARLDGHYFDCRVLMVAGEPAFLVVRQNRHPITNLHLLGWRGERASLDRDVPPALFEQAMQSCRTVFAAHRCLHLGIDVMFEDGYGGHRVIEANAFGDLLPNLTRDGLSVYEWEVREVVGGR